MFKIIRLRLFVVLGLIAAVFIAARPHSVGAAGGPTVKTSYFYPAGTCSTGGGENSCTTNSDNQ